MRRTASNAETQQISVNGRGGAGTDKYICGYVEKERRTDKVDLIDERTRPLQQLRSSSGT